MKNQKGQKQGKKQKRKKRGRNLPLQGEEKSGILLTIFQSVKQFHSRPPGKFFPYLILFSLLYYCNAYVCDDAFLSFRTVDNFVHGYGLRWNVGERVQTFTNPLSTLLISIPYFLVHDPGGPSNPHVMWAISILFSYLLSSGVILFLVWRAQDSPSLWITFSLLLCSQAFVTFFSSGLETSISYLLIVLFFGPYLWSRFPEKARSKTLVFYFLIAALAVVNRIDTLLLFFPACLHLGALGFQQLRHKMLGVLALASLPLILWFGFALVYFGFLLPNSYYAKLGLDASPALLIRNGLHIMASCLRSDPITIPIIVLPTMIIAIFPHKLRPALAQAGGLLYVLYFIKIGGDFIGFRFFALSALLSALILLSYLERIPTGRLKLQLGIASIIAGLAYSLLIPHSPLRCAFDGPFPDDVRYYYPGSALSKWRPGKRFPFATFHALKDFDSCSSIWANTFRISVTNGGIRGFCRGPQDHIIDPYGITDPLIARLPSSKISNLFSPGHLMKEIPLGYIDSIRENQDLIRDPELAAYYDKIRTVVSGQLFSAERWRDIFKLNFTPARRYTKTYLGENGLAKYDHR